MTKLLFAALIVATVPAHMQADDKAPAKPFFKSAKFLVPALILMFRLNTKKASDYTGNGTINWLPASLSWNDLKNWLDNDVIGITGQSSSIKAGKDGKIEVKDGRDPQGMLGTVATACNGMTKTLTALAAFETLRGKLNDRGLVSETLNVTL